MKNNLNICHVFLLLAFFLLLQSIPLTSSHAEGYLLEDFETGDLTKFDWVTSGDDDWMVTGNNPYNGSFSAESPGITDDESASLDLAYTCEAGEISFWLSVDSEAGGDELLFYIDDELQGTWSGSVAYTSTTYEVTAGIHTFSWEYLKDSSGSIGSDSAWIDDILFPPEKEYVHEDFETGDLTKFDWVTSGDDDWTVTGDNPYNGSFSAESPGMNDNEGASLELAYACEAGVVSFWVEVDSEESSDELMFYIDDELQGAWSGAMAYTSTTYEVTAGMHTFKWEYLKDSSGSNGSDKAWIDDILFPPEIPYVLEDFETGDLTKFDWVTSGDDDWAVTGDNPYNGSFSAESPVLNDNENASLDLAYACEAGEISFWVEVDSEAGGDELLFYIDDELQGTWSGSMAYTSTAYEVTAGIHTFSWEYLKDSSGSIGSDSAWIDDILFPPEKEFVLEDFETGDLTKFDWVTSGDDDWTVTGDNPYNGSFSAESPGLNDNEQALLELEYPCEEGEVSFWVEVDSEEGADELMFYIDDELQGAWSGAMAYTSTAFEIDAGTHTFKWKYNKDSSGSSGSDKAWIDDIFIPSSTDMNLDSDGDGITDIDETNIYGTDPNDPDSDDDGINDGDELDYWGNDWNNNFDGDGIQNDLLDDDSDNDGYLDGEEIDGGSDPAEPDDCISTPDKPVAIYPADGAEKVGLPLILVASDFVDPHNCATFSKSQWMFSKNEDFSGRPIKITKKYCCRNFLWIPGLFVRNNTTYYWKVRYWGSNENVSEWSDTASFTVGFKYFLFNANGIKSTQAVDDVVDLNKDGIFDNAQSDNLKSIHAAEGNMMLGVEALDSIMTGIEAIDSSIVPENDDIPDEVPYGLISFRLEVDSPGQRAVVKIYLSEPAPKNAYWVHYDEENGWIDYSDHAEFNENRDIVTLEFQDGGYGDSDRTEDGVIIDPSGLAIGDNSSFSSASSKDSDHASAGAGGGCFISTLF